MSGYDWQLHRDDELMRRNNDLLERVRQFDTLQSRVSAWVRSRIGDAHMHPRERAMRLLEEAVELAQAEGLAFPQVIRQVGHVYNRPAGEPAQEIAGIAVCALGYCQARGLRFADVALAEIERIEAKPLEAIRGSLARKADADLVTCVDGTGEHVREGE